LEDGFQFSISGRPFLAELREAAEKGENLKKKKFPLTSLPLFTALSTAPGVQSILITTFRLAGSSAIAPEWRFHAEGVKFPSHSGRPWQ